MTKGRWPARKDAEVEVVGAAGAAGAAAAEVAEEGVDAGAVADVEVGGDEG